jgi:hypothetical protein
MNKDGYTFFLVSVNDVIIMAATASVHPTQSRCSFSNNQILDHALAPILVFVKGYGPRSGGFALATPFSELRNARSLAKNRESMSGTSDVVSTFCPHGRECNSA